jgi:hypothetical protein
MAHAAAFCSATFGAYTDRSKICTLAQYRIHMRVSAIWSSSKPDMA